MRSRTPKRLPTLLTVGLVAVAGGLGPGTDPAWAVPRQQVDTACAQSDGALEVYEVNHAAFVEAANELDRTRVEIDENAAFMSRTESQIEHQRARVEQLESEVSAQAGELYIQAVASPGFLLLETPEALLTVGPALESATTGGLAALDDVAAARAQLDRFSAELGAIAAELSDLEQVRSSALEAQQDALEAASAAYDLLDQACRDAKSEYEAELARERERERAAAAAERDAAGGGDTAPPPVVDGFACPFTPGRTQFIDSWGYPRSGGRSHEGADMMAAWDEPVYAVQSGVVEVENHGLGGNHIWLLSDNGPGYYYAHLNSFAVGNGARVSQGQLVGYNGASGNAAGGAPHVHFQIHPNGRSGSPVNPYPTLAGACF